MSRFLRIPLLISCLLGAALQLSGCMFLDDFGVFEADPNVGKDASVEQDAGNTPDVDAAGGGSDSGPDESCDGVDCSDMDSECHKGVCKKGKCEAAAANEGDSCTDATKCIVNSVCSDGVCKGQDKDCSAKDEPCVNGVCNPMTERPQSRDAARWQRMLRQQSLHRRRDLHGGRVRWLPARLHLPRC